MRGPSPALVACWGPRRGRPRRWRGSPGPQSQPLARPPRSPLRRRQPSAMCPVPAPGLPPVSAACRGPRSGPRRGSLGLQSPFPARLGPLQGRGGRACCLGGQGGHLGWLRLLGQRPGVDGGRPGLPSRRPDQHRSGEPSESAITVILVGCVMAGAPFPLPAGASVSCRGQCRAVLCGGEGGRGCGAGCGVNPCTGRGRRLSIGIWRGGGGFTRPTRRATAPSLGRGSGPWAPGGRLVVPGGAALGGPP